MKSFLAADGKTSKAGARNATLMNLFGTPGLGSLMARRWTAGTLQLALFLAGFILFCVWVFPTITSYYRLPFSDDPVPTVPGKDRAMLGLLLCVISWFWSLGTSLSLMRESSRAEADALKAALLGKPPAKSAAPPVLASPSIVPGWQREGEVISRTFQFAGFPAAMEFVNAVAQLAEQAQHHPEIDIRWNKVTLALTTHDARGLTEKDFALARQCNDIDRE